MRDLSARIASLSADKRALLMTRLKQKVESHSPHREHIFPKVLPPVSLSQVEIDHIFEQVPGGTGIVQDIYPLTPLQEGFLFHHLMSVHGDVYLQSSLLAFDTRARLAGFLDALQAVINRHDILRTAIVWEGLSEPVQIVWREAHLIVEEVTLDLDAKDPSEQLRARFNPRRFRMDIRQAPLMRGFIARDAAERRWLLLLLSHHLAIDHTTVAVIVKEVQAYVDGKAHRLPEPRPFRNFVINARAQVHIDGHEAFFQKMLGDVTEPTAPFGLLDVYGNGSNVGEAVLALDADLSRRLRFCARTIGVSAASLCHLAFARILAVVSRREDVVFGTVLFGRMKGGIGIDETPGMFINTLPIRIRMGKQGVNDVAHQTHAGLVALLSYEHTPLVLAQRCSAVPAPTPLFSAIFNYRYSPDDAQAEPEKATQLWDGVEVLASEERTNYPIALAVDDLGDGFWLTAQVQEPLEPRRFCDYMQRALSRLVAALETDPNVAVCCIQVVPETECKQLLLKFTEEKDHKSLLVPDPEIQFACQYVAPRNHTEEVLVKIWAELFGLDRVGIHDNFFTLGGHSLLLIRLVCNVQASFNQKLSLRNLFERPTVAGLAELIEDGIGLEIFPNE